MLVVLGLVYFNLQGTDEMRNKMGDGYIHGNRFMLPRKYDYDLSFLLNNIIIRQCKSYKWKIISSYPKYLY